MKSSNIVPEEWIEGMVSDIQLQMRKSKMAVDERPNITHYLFKCDVCPLSHCCTHAESVRGES